MVIYDSIIEGLQFLPPEQRGQVLTAVAEYVYYGREPEFEMDPACMAMFVAQKPSLDEQRARSAAGKRSGESRRAKREQALNKPRTNREQTLNKPRTNAEQTANEEEQEQEVEKPSASAEGKKRAARFVPPTPEEVDAYIAEKGFAGFTGQQFVDHYEANGWMRGKSKVRDWKACVRTWATRERGTARARAAPKRGVTDWSVYELPVEEA